MLLLWIIIDQLKIEKRAKLEGWEPACTMEERLGAYFFIIVLPLILAILKGKS